MATHADRLIDEARRRRPRTVAVSQAAFDRWNQQVQRQSKPVQLYLTACNPRLSTYFVNCQHDTAYHRHQTITASRRPQPAPHAEELSA